MSRIIWLSNASWAPSGYGEQTATYVPRLQALGHDVAIAANYGLQAAQFEHAGTTVYPADGNWGNDKIGTFVEHFDADYVIALCDAWVLKPDSWPDDMKLAVWAPIDHWPIPPAVLAVLQHPKVRPIAMSKFGLEWMQKFSLDALYVPHGIDTQVFKPMPEQRDAIRRELEIPEDGFLVGMVAANKGSPQMPRKSFPQAFDAFAYFAREHPDAHMYVHTTPGDNYRNGIDLLTLARAVGIPEDRIRFTPPSAFELGIPKTHVASMYQAFDVLMNPSMGEGFGIPIVEAQACGVPVITADHSAMTELTHAGWCVGGDRWWDAMQESFAIIPSVAGLVQALEEAYEARGDEKLRASAVEFGMTYDADLVTVQYWEPVLEALGKPREVAPLNGKTRQVRRAEERKRAKAAA